MEYILTITKNTDVKYRFTFVNKIHNLCMEIIENLYSANFTKLGNEKRNEYQVNAQSKLHYLDFVWADLCSYNFEIVQVNFEKYYKLNLEKLQTI